MAQLDVHNHIDHDPTQPVDVTEVSHDIPVAHEDRNTRKLRGRVAAALSALLILGGGIAVGLGLSKGGDTSEGVQSDPTEEPAGASGNETVADSTEFFEDNLTSEQASLLRDLAPYGYQTTYSGPYNFDVSDPESVASNLSELFMVANNTGLSEEDTQTLFGSTDGRLDPPSPDYFFGFDPDNQSAPRNLTVSPTASGTQMSFEFSTIYTDRNDREAIEGILDLVDSGEYDGSASQGGVDVSVQANISSSGTLQNISWQGINY